MFKTSNVHMVVNMIRFEGSDVIDIERMSALPNGATRRQEGVGVSAPPLNGVCTAARRETVCLFVVVPRSALGSRSCSLPPS